MGMTLNVKEQQAVDSWNELSKQAFLPLQHRVRMQDWVRTSKRPYGVEIAILPNQENGQLTTKEKEALLSVAHTWRDVNWPGKSVEEVDAMGIYLTVYQSTIKTK